MILLFRPINYIPEPHRVFRRLQLVRRMEHHEQDNEQVSPEVRDRAVRLVLDTERRHALEIITECLIVVLIKVLYLL